MLSDSGNEVIFTREATPLRYDPGMLREVTEEDLTNISRESMQSG